MLRRSQKQNEFSPKHIKSVIQYKEYMKLNSLNTQEEGDKIFMSRNELVQFIKKFAIDKLEIEEKIEDLKSQNTKKDQKIISLERQIQDLNSYQQQLKNIIQKMKQNKSKELEQVKTQAMRRNSINIGNQLQTKREIIKLKENLQYSQQQCSRYRQFLKIKQQIISNLIWQKNNLKQMNMMDTLRIKDNNIQNKSPFSKTNRKLQPKTIVLRRKNSFHKTTKMGNKNIQKNISQQLQGQRKRCLNLQNQNKILKTQIQKDKYQKPDKLDVQDIKNTIGGKYKVNNDKLLAQKCLFLQRQIQKLTYQLKDMKNKKNNTCSCGNRQSQESIVQQKIFVQDGHNFYR